MRKLLLLLVAAVALAQRPWPPPGMQCPQRILVLTEVVQAQSSRINDFYDEHLAYIIPFMKAGKVLSAGPTTDGRGVIIFAVKEWSEAEEIMKKEPFTREGIMKTTSHTVWNACEAAK